MFFLTQGKDIGRVFVLHVYFLYFSSENEIAGSFWKGLFPIYVKMAKYLVLETPSCRRAGIRLFLMEQIIFHLWYNALAKQKDFNRVCSISSPWPGGLPIDTEK